jgi:ferredoxin
MTARPAGARLRVDPIACDGRGLCAELLPELITLDDWGYPMISDAAVPGHLLADARETVRACPLLALRLEHRRSDQPQPDPGAVFNQRWRPGHERSAAPHG